MIMRIRPSHFFLLILTLLTPTFFAFAGTIIDPDKYAWSNDVGYINFANVIVGDSALSGYAWSANTGWINFAPTNGGVTNDGQGDLFGYAWGSGLGWINFSGVTIDANGQFHGIATGPLVGEINFDCATYCNVTTDWRHVAQTSGGGGGGSGSTLFYGIPQNFGVGYGAATSAPGTSATSGATVITQDTNSGPVSINIPAGSLFKNIVFTVSDEPLVPANARLVLANTHLINNAFYTISARDQNNMPVDTFSRPIVITLPAPKGSSSTKTFGVYWLNTANEQWVLIPDAVFAGNKAIFATNYVTTFAVFQTMTKSINPQTNTVSAPSLSLPAGIGTTTLLFHAPAATTSYQNSTSAPSTHQAGSLWQTILNTVLNSKLTPILIPPSISFITLLLYFALFK